MKKNYLNNKNKSELSPYSSALSFFHFSSYGSFSSYASFFSSYSSFYTSLYSSYTSGSENGVYYLTKEYMVRQILEYESYLEFIRNMENIQDFPSKKKDILKKYQISEERTREISKGNLSYSFFSLGYGIELI